MVDLSAYREMYIQESGEYLKRLDTSLLTLAAKPDAENALQDARIAAHSLKGISLVMNYAEPARIASEVEDLLNAVLEGAPFDPTSLGATLRDLEAAVSDAAS